MDYEISFKDISVTATTCSRYSNSHYEGIYIRWMLCRRICIVAVWYLLRSFDML